MKIEYQSSRKRRLWRGKIKEFIVSTHNFWKNKLFSLWDYENSNWLLRNQLKKWKWKALGDCTSDKLGIHNLISPRKFDKNVMMFSWPLVKIFFVILFLILAKLLILLLLIYIFDCFQVDDPSELLRWEASENGLFLSALDYGF